MIFHRIIYAARFRPHSTAGPARTLQAGLVCLLLAIAFAPSSASAQEELPQGNVSLSFTAVGMGNRAVTLTYFNDGAERTLTAPSFNRSPRYNYTGPSKLTFYLPPSPDAQDLQSRIAGSVELPAGIRKAMLVFVPDAAGRYQILPLVDNEDSFPDGRARIFNATSQPLAVKAGDAEVKLLPPGEQLLASGNGINLLLQVAYREDESWKIAASSLFGLKPNNRRTIFLTVSDSPVFRSQAFDGSEIPPAPIQIFTVNN